MNKDSNSTLNKHINKHCGVLRSVPEEGQSSMGVDGSIFNYSEERCRERFAQFVIQDCLPFNHFENPRLTNVIQETLQPRYRQVSRSTLKRDCMRMYKVAKQELVTLLENLNTSVNLTTDAWSAPHGLPGSYICVTAHWVDPSTWQMMKRTIAFENFEEPHTGDALFILLSQVMAYFKIERKVFSISFDNASNNTSAVRKLKIKYQPPCDGIFYHGRCVAHILNLVVQSGLGVEEIEGIKKDFRSMLQEVFCGGKARMKKYMKLCKETNSVCLSPTWDCPTRWNSTLKMFENALRQKSTLEEFHDGLVRNRRALVKFTGWDIIKRLCELLQVFKHATTLLSGVYYPTSHSVLNQIFLISEKLNEFEFVDDGQYEKMVFAMKAKLKKYFKEMPPIFVCAAALNPTLNVSGVELFIEKISYNLGLYDDDVSIGDRLKADFNRQFHALFLYYNEKFGSSSSSSTPSSFFATTQHQPNPQINMYNMLMEENTKRARGEGSNSRNSEFGRYTGTYFASNMGLQEFMSFDKHILDWWKKMEPQFPVLASMARDILSVQASTVASESAFSESGRVLSIRRTRLTPESLEMCICFKDHLDAINRIQDKTSLELDAFQYEQDIHNEEVEDGEVLSLSDEEIRLDEAMRSNSEEE